MEELVLLAKDLNFILKAIKYHLGSLNRLV